MTDERRRSTNVVRNLSVISTNDNKRIKLPKVYTQDVLPFDVNDVPSHEVVRRWPHLRCLISEIPDLDKSVPIGLLIGVDCPGALQPCDVIFSVNNGPFAVKTALGWCISGPKQQYDEEINGAEVIACCCANVNDQRVQTTETGSEDGKLRMYGQDFSEQTSEMILCTKWSPVDLTDARSSNQNDRKFLNKVNDGSRITNENNQLLLPCRHPNVHIPDDRVQVQLFGTEFPPSSAKYALQGAVANDNTEIFGATSAETLRTNFHVDDLLSSADNVDQATTIVRGALRRCAAVEFHSTEFASSGQRIVDARSMKDRTKNIENADLMQTPCPIEQALGVYSHIVNDTIGFKIDLKDELFTGKDILATTGSIYDPLSLVVTFSMTCKRILQDLCSMKMEWNDKISDDSRTIWKRRRKGVMKSEMISVAPCLEPPCFDRISSSDVHTGADLNAHKRIAVVCATGAMQDVDKQISARIFTTNSSCYKLKKNVAWILIIIEQLEQRSKKLPIRDVSVGLTVDELKYAEVRMIKCVQKQFRCVELAAIELRGDHLVAGSRRIPGTSPAYRLTPMLSAHGLLCVGGRLNRSTLPTPQAHQIILPGSHQIAALVVDYYHNVSGHSGREFVLSLIREKFWILGARQLIRRVLRRCIVCRKCYAPPCEQRMSDLPIDRTTPNFPPFTFVEVDLFGLILVKVGRSDVKRYGCIFTCMASRAVHIEVVHSLEADSFINALQRFLYAADARHWNTDQRTERILLAAGTRKHANW